MNSDRRLFITADGSHSIATGSDDLAYHSRHGAIQESRHVFIDAALHHRGASQKQLSILEIGLGTGLNALLTWLAAEQVPYSIRYTAYELFPLSVEQVVQLNYPTLLGQDQVSTQLAQLHDCSWEEVHQLSPQFQFCKHQQHFDQIDDVDRYDIIYFDAFAPEAQPELWETPLLAKMYRSLKDDGLLSTYCAKGVVKRRLKALGFTIEAIPGPPGKREMTRAIKKA